MGEVGRDSQPVERELRGFRYAPGVHRFEVRQEARIEALRSGVVDSLTSLAYLTYTLTPAGDSMLVTGTIDSFTVVTGDSIPRPLHPAGFPIGFSALIDAQGAVREFASPDTSTCGSPAGALLALARDVLVPVPTDLAPGVRWQDSVSTTTCRGDVPITVLAIRDHRAGSHGRDGTAAEIRRNARMEISGTGTGPVQATSITGSGESRQRIVLDRVMGALRSAEGESRLVLVFDAASRRETFHQRAAFQVRRLPES